MPDDTPTTGTSTTGTSTAELGGYTAKVAERIVGITYRQLDHWARIGLLKPSLRAASGSGSRRLYGYTDLLELKVIKALREAGITLDKIKEIFNFVRHQLQSSAEVAHIVINGNGVTVLSGGQLVEVLNRPGQGVFNVLPMEPIVRELRENIAKVQPEIPITDEQCKLLAD